ncbi:DUF4177 domain-containing protein [Opitutus terrae]|uniref:DUF4177 domain-containing protein n=1 Tax=Opitutus terrae (strain DSM 11246 / JCM 15787 / PB90-1) TaxID=452637 RepID=B1ZYF0_OPITP|nr:DUF4177 domain-containing protein [Opitutus terrae]ACB77048.1 hypothetical protein Oter_3773 [Opitutus terrae PB90-1]
MKYEYKVVPFIGRIQSGQGADIAAQQLQSVISQHATGGWELVQLGDVNIEVKPGCLAGLFGSGVTYVRFDQLIFRRAS